MKSSALKLVFALWLFLVAVVGVGIFVYGEADDSPGAQLIGVAVTAGAVAVGVSTFLRRR